MTDDVHALQTELAKTRRELAQLKGRYGPPPAWSMTPQEMRDEVARLKGELDDQFDDLNDKLAYARSDLREARAEVARLKAELTLETDQANRWARIATASVAVIHAARQALETECGDPTCERCQPIYQLGDAIAELDKAEADD